MLTQQATLIEKAKVPLMGETKAVPMIDRTVREAHPLAPVNKEAPHGASLLLTRKNLTPPSSKREKMYSISVKGKYQQGGRYYFSIRFKLRMLTIAAFLVGLWFLGLMLSVTFGGMIHMLLIVGLVMAITKIIGEGTSADAAF